MAELTVTPAAKIRGPRERGYLFTLPSGTVVRLRPVALDALIRSGKIPNLLMPVVAKMLWTQAGDQDDRTPEEVDAENRKHFLDLIAVIAPAAMLYPRVVDDPQNDDEIALDDLPFGDKYAIYTLAKLPAEVLETFSRQQIRVVESVQPGEELQPATEPAA